MRPQMRARVPELIVSDTRTLALEILLEALEADVPWGPYDEDAQEGLYVMGETRFLAQQEKHGFDIGP